MHRFLLLATGFAVICACAAPPAQAAEPARQQCFWASQVRGFSSSGPDRALVRLGGRDMWELTLSPGCPDVDWAMRIGIVSRGSQRICSGRDAELLVPDASEHGVQRCLVREIRKLSPEEAAAARGDKPATDR